MNTDIFSMIDYASRKNIFTSTSTNAHFLDSSNIDSVLKSGLNKLIISIDGTDQESYSKYRIGGDLNKVLKGTEALVREKKLRGAKKPLIYLQFIVMKSNQHQINEMVNIANKIGVKAIFKTAQVYNMDSEESILPDNPEWSRYVKGNNGRLRIKNEYSNKCWRMWSSTVVTWDGKVVPCCFDKDAVHQMGDVSENNFTETWNNGNFEAFRKAVISGRDQIEICRNCTEGSKVWI